MYLHRDLPDTPDARAAMAAHERSQPPTRLAGAANAALALLWRSGALPAPELSAEAMIARAMAAERLDDFGPDHWQAPFATLMDALETEADLSPLGRTLAYGQLMKVLRERLRAHALWRKYPAIRQRPVRAPIIVAGAMRSGTTRIQRLLACDDRLAHTRLFESLSPVPGRRRPDLRATSAAAGLGFLKLLNPALGAVHPSGAKLPDEEFGLFGFSFSGAQFEAQWRVPSFARALEAGDSRPAYTEFRALLQTIAWSRGEDRPWVLKAPQFQEDLEALLAVFPDARLLCLHRDPVAVVGSSCSLVWEQQRVQSHSASRAWIGREWLRKTARRERCAAEARRRLTRVPQIDIAFDRVDRDWRGAMRRIYAFLELPFTVELERRMAAYLAGATEHRGHRYALEDFGLTAGQVRRALGR